MLVGSRASSVLVSPVEGRDLEQVGGRKGHWNTCVMKAEVEAGREEGGQQGEGRWRGETRARGREIKTV